MIDLDKQQQADGNSMNNEVRVVPLYEGTFSVGTDKILKRIDRDDKPYKGELKLSVNPFLICEEDRNILFDAGIGELAGEESAIQKLLQNIEKQSLTEFDISDIFLSHLHLDHIGGLANREEGYWQLTFPNARIWVSEEGWKDLGNQIEKAGEEASEFYHFLDLKADLHFLGNEEESPVPHVRTRQIGGHSEHHLILFYEDGDQRYLMAGDVIGTRAAINRSYAAKYDFDPEQSMKMRSEIQVIAYEKSYVIMAYHDTEMPLFKLTEYSDKKGYKIENANS